jgi:hypothetical protein
MEKANIGAMKKIHDGIVIFLSVESKVIGRKKKEVKILAPT